MINSQAQAALFHKDTPGNFEETLLLGGNPAYEDRAIPTKDGGICTLEGSLYLNFGIGQNRAILNGVGITLKLFQSSDDFRLMRHGSKIYKLVIPY